MRHVTFHDFWEIFSVLSGNDIFSNKGFGRSANDTLIFFFANIIFFRFGIRSRSDFEIFLRIFGIPWIEIIRSYRRFKFFRLTPFFTLIFSMIL